MSDILLRKHTDAVIAALEGAALVVGDHEAPEGAGRQPDETFDKYVVVYKIPGGKRSGNLDDPDGDAELIYQVTCVGSSRNEAEWLADKVDVTLRAGISVAGRDVTVRPDGTHGLPRDDNVTPPIFSATPRFRVKTTPA